LKDRLRNFIQLLWLLCAHPRVPRERAGAHTHIAAKNGNGSCVLNSEQLVHASQRARDPKHLLPSTMPKVTPPKDNKPLGEVLLLGLEGAGKTLLCRHLEQKCAAKVGKKGGKKGGAKAAGPTLKTDTQPSIGIELLELRHRDTSFAVREIGGAMQQVWSRYYSGASTVLFVADSSSTEAAASAAVEVCEILRLLPDRRVCLLLNKRDAPAALPAEAVSMLCGVTDLEAYAGDDRLKVVSGSALTGDGLDEILEWCHAALHERAELEALIAAKEAKAKAGAGGGGAPEEAAAAGGSAAPVRKRGLFGRLFGARSADKAGAEGGAAMGNVAPGAAASLPAPPEGSKTVFFVRHAQSRWNLASHRPWRMPRELLRVDHPLTAKGHKQALALRGAAFTGPAASGALEGLKGASVVWASPYTRAVQTALAGLLPLWVDAANDGTLPPHVVAGAPAPSLQLRPLIRERKNTLVSRDNVGGAKGSKIVPRAVRHLKRLPKAARPAEAVAAMMTGSVPAETGEVGGRWWTRTSESRAGSRKRATATLTELAASEHTTMIVVSHSHFLRALFGAGLSDEACTPELAAALRKRKIPNCGVVVCSVSADGKITRAALGFAPTGSKPLVAATKKAKERTKKPKAKQVVPEPTQAD
jgi:broad specificity phosphatase PhoE/signal recognition particle receptor subunit beta